jgi:hypothetical protein
MSGHTPDFDWNCDDVITVPGQAAIACYLNPKGAVVIRQEGQYGIDEDVWVVVAPAHVPMLCRELMALIGAENPLDMTEVDELVAAAESKDRPAPLSNSERQRLYRQRHRNENNENSNETAELPLRHVNGADQEREVLHAAE